MVSNATCGALIKTNISFLFFTFKEACVAMGEKYWLDTFRILTKMQDLMFFMLLEDNCNLITLITSEVTVLIQD